MEVYASADQQRLYNEVVHEFYDEVQDKDIQQGVEAAVLHESDEGGYRASDNGAKIRYDICHPTQNAERDRIADPDEPEPRRSQYPYDKTVSGKPAEILSNDDIDLSNDRNGRFHVRRRDPVHDPLHNDWPVLKEEKDKEGDENERHDKWRCLHEDLGGVQCTFEKSARTEHMVNEFHDA